MEFLTGLIAKGTALGASALANWQALAIKALVVILILAAAFGLGYRSGTQTCVKAAVAHTEVVQTAQHKQDKKDHDAANKAGKDADDRHKAGDAAIKPVIERIKGDTIYVRIPVNDPHACDFTQTALDALNEAGTK